MAELLSEEWWAEKQKAGVVPPEVRRIIIDVSYNQPVKVYFESYADGQIVDVISDLLLTGKQTEDTS